MLPRLNCPGDRAGHRTAGRNCRRVARGPARTERRPVSNCDQTWLLGLSLIEWHTLTLAFREERAYTDSQVYLGSQGIHRSRNSGSANTHGFRVSESQDITRMPGFWKRVHIRIPAFRKPGHSRILAFAGIKPADRPAVLRTSGNRRRGNCNGVCTAVMLAARSMNRCQETLLYA